MLEGTQFENDIVPKRWAVMFKPAKIALEYHVKSIQSDRLLEIELEEKLKCMQSATKISEILYKTYSDVLIKSIVPERQVINLINKIIAHQNEKKIFKSKAESPKNFNINIINSMEKYPRQSPEKGIDDKLYSKSTQNFFTTTSNNSNINFIDETLQSESSIKSELEQINLHAKSKYLEEGKDEQVNSHSLENYGHSSALLKQGKGKPAANRYEY